MLEDFGFRAVVEGASKFVQDLTAMKKAQDEAKTSIEGVSAAAGDSKAIDEFGAAAKAAAEGSDALSGAASDSKGALDAMTGAADASMLEAYGSGAASAAGETGQLASAAETGASALEEMTASADASMLEAYGAGAAGAAEDTVGLAGAAGETETALQGVSEAADGAVLDSYADSAVGAAEGTGELSDAATEGASTLGELSDSADASMLDSWASSAEVAAGGADSLSDAALSGAGAMDDVTNAADDAVLISYGSSAEAAARDFGELGDELLNVGDAAEDVQGSFADLGNVIDPAAIDAYSASAEGASDATGEMAESGGTAGTAFNTLSSGATITATALGNLNVGAKALGGTLGGAFALGTSIAQLNELAKEVYDLGLRLGGTAEEASKLIYAFEDIDISVGSGIAAVTRLSKGIAGIADAEDLAFQAGEPLIKQLTDIGVEFFDLDGKAYNTYQILSQIADAFKNTIPPADQAAVAIRIFGRSGTSLLPLLTQGSEGLKDLGDEAERTGNVLSGDLVAAVRANKNEMDVFHKELDGLQIQLAVALLPIIEALTSSMTQLAHLMNITVMPAITFFKDTLGGLLDTLHLVEAANYAVGGAMLLTLLPTIVKLIASTGAWIVSQVGAIGSLFGLGAASATAAVSEGALAVATTGATTAIVAEGAASGTSGAAIMTTLVPATVAGTGGFTAMAAAVWAAILPLTPFIALIAALGVEVALIVIYWDELTQAYEEMFGGAASKVADLFDEHRTVILALAGVISGGLIPAIVYLAENWEDVVSVFEDSVDFFRDLPGEILDFFKDLPGDIVDIFEDLPGDMVEIGESIIDGIWEGIKNKVTGFLGDLRDMVGGFLDTIKDAAGVHSPSTKTYPIGQDIVVGLEEGFNAEFPNFAATASAQVNQLMGSLAASVNLGMQRMSAATNAAAAKMNTLKFGGDIIPNPGNLGYLDPGAIGGFGINTFPSTEDIWTQKDTDALFESMFPFDPESFLESSLTKAPKKSGGGGGGGSSKVEEAAKSAAELFAESLAKSLEEQRLEDLFGDEGAAVMESFRDALVNPKSAENIPDLIERLVDEAKDAGVPNAEELGMNLASAVGSGLVDGSEDAVASGLQAFADALDKGAGVQSLMDRIARDLAEEAKSEELRAQFGSAGVSLIEAVTDGIEEGSDANMDRVAKSAESLLKTIDDKMGPGGKKLGDALLNALEKSIRDKTPEAQAALEDLLRKINIVVEGGIYDIETGTTMMADQVSELASKLGIGASDIIANIQLLTETGILAMASSLDAIQPQVKANIDKIVQDVKNGVMSATQAIGLLKNIAGPFSPGGPTAGGVSHTPDENSNLQGVPGYDWVFENGKWSLVPHSYGTDVPGVFGTNKPPAGYVDPYNHPGLTWDGSKWVKTSVYGETSMPAPPAGSSAIAVLEHGTNEIEKDTFAFLHRGEAVVPAHINRALQQLIDPHWYQTLMGSVHAPSDGDSWVGQFQNTGARRAWDPSVARMPDIISGSSFPTVNVDMHGSQFNGTPAENGKAVRREVEAVIDRYFGRGAFLAGTR